MSNFAVIETGGKQYLVQAGDTVKVEKLEVKDGETLSFDPLLVGDDTGDVQVGKPTVKGAKVAAKVVGQGRHEKVTVVKFKNKIRYKRKAGHRQRFTELKIETVK